MTKIRYGKRNRVPETCPVCGAKGPSGPYNEFQALLRNYLLGWTPYFYKQDPEWHIPQWWGFCGTCQNRALLATPIENTLIGRISKERTWRGSTFKVPFKGTP